MFAKALILALFFQYIPYPTRDRIRSLAFRTGPGPSRYIGASFLSEDNVEQYLSRCRKLEDFTIVVDRFEIFSNLRMAYWQDEYLKCWPRMMKTVAKKIERKDSNWKSPEMKIEIWAGWERPGWDMMGELRRSWAAEGEFVLRSEDPRRAHTVCVTPNNDIS